MYSLQFHFSSLKGGGGERERERVLGSSVARVGGRAAPAGAFFLEGDGIDHTKKKLRGGQTSFQSPQRRDTQVSLCSFPGIIHNGHGDVIPKGHPE